MVEENGNSSLDPLGGESASTHNNSDETSTQHAQQTQLSTSSLHHHHQNASPSAAVLATSANIVQFIPAQSIQVSSFTIIITHLSHTIRFCVNSEKAIQSSSVKNYDFYASYHWKFVDLTNPTSFLFVYVL